MQSIDDLTAGGDGIDAESNAVATADFDQSADQENDNELTASGTLVDQDQVVLQFNVSDQDGEADAYASSGDVSVSQTGKLSSGGTGIIASSNAAAIATLEQTADQDNSNTISADATDAFEQEQPFILQENFNEQQGEADATAYSGDVSVLNSEDPSHEDGIDAESKAFAKAEIDQEASQENSNGIGEEHHPREHQRPICRRRR